MKDVQRCYSRVKVSYDVRSSSIEHQRYKEKCYAFYDVTDVASKNKEIHKSVLTWIEKAMTDVLLNVRCQSEKWVGKLYRNHIGSSSMSS